VEGPDYGKRGARAYNGVRGGAPSGVQGRAPGQRVTGAKPPPPEAESFMRIGHPKEGANWPHVRVLNKRNCIPLLDSNETVV